MSTFVQLHFLTSYPVANPNRDDMGRPKTAQFGGVDRLRISSQCLKRTWRTSEEFTNVFEGKLGKRTRRLGYVIFDYLVKNDISEKDAIAWSQAIMEKFGTLDPKSENKLQIREVVNVTPVEKQNIYALLDKLIAEKREPKKEELDQLQSTTPSVDCALFGRMLASSPNFNIEAAAQVAHAVSVSPALIEEDYFTAVDDLSAEFGSAGSAHLNEAGFSSGLFYGYVCINRDLLLEHLNHDDDLTNDVISQLFKTALTVTPSGKQNTFASRAYASYAMVEVGQQQPRSLAVSYLKPVTGEKVEEEAIAAFVNTRNKFDQVYGQCADRRYEINVSKGEGNIADMMEFLKEIRE